MKNGVANKAADVVSNYIRRNPRIGIHIDGFYKVELSGYDAQQMLEMCSWNADCSNLNVFFTYLVS